MGLPLLADTDEVFVRAHSFPTSRAAGWLGYDLLCSPYLHGS